MCWASISSCVCVCVSLNHVCLLETSLQAWKRVMIEKRKDVDSTTLTEITLCDNCTKTFWSTSSDFIWATGRAAVCLCPWFWTLPLVSKLIQDHGQRRGVLAAFQQPPGKIEAELQLAAKNSQWHDSHLILRVMSAMLLMPDALQRVSAQPAYWVWQTTDN